MNSPNSNVVATVASTFEVIVVAAFEVIVVAAFVPVDPADPTRFST